MDFANFSSVARNYEAQTFQAREKKSSRPTKPCDGPRMNPSVDVGNPPRPFRHLRMAEHRSPDPSSSRVPVHSALVQKSVTAITYLGRPAFNLDARQKAGAWQVEDRKKMAGCLQLK